MSRQRLSVVDEEEIKNIIKNSSQQDIEKYAFKYLVQLELGRKRISRKRQIDKEKKSNEKNKY